MYFTFMKIKSKKLFKLYLAATLIFPSHFVFAAPISFHLSKWKEKITIYPRENRFVSEIKCQGNSIERSSTILIPYSETEAITDLHVSYLDRLTGIVFKDSVKIFNNSFDSESFYSNMHLYGFQVPATPAFDFSFSRSEQDLMFLASLNMNPYTVTDTVEYEIRVQKEYAFLYKMCNIDSSVTVIFDSVVSSNDIIYHITILNHPVKKSEYEKLKKSHPAVLNSIPDIKTLFLPKSESATPEKYLNQWLQRLYSRIPGLTRKNFLAIKSETGNLNDTDALIKNVFRFVQTKIKYIDIENGINAFKPRDPNRILEQRQGDCKDMAFLIHSILNQYGIKSNLALSASISHPFDMDFPSLASANHIVCTVFRNDRWIFLDATEDVCEYGFPSLQIQGKHVFISGDGQGAYKYVNPVPAAENESVFKILLNADKMPAAGNFIYQFRRTGATFYKHFYNDLNKTDFELFTKEVFKNLATGCSHDSIVTTTTDSTISFAGNISMNHALIQPFGSKYYLPLNFIPYLDGLPKVHKVTEPLICSSPLNKKSRVELKFSNKFQLINERNVKFNENGFAFEFSLQQNSASTFVAETRIIYDDVIVPISKLEAYHNMILFIDNELSKGIVYE